MVNITDNSYFKQNKIPNNECRFYKKRILSVLEIRKMIPVIDSVYTIVDLSTNNPSLSRDEISRRILMYKEYLFCRRIKNEILTKADKTYNKQIQTGKVLKYHCNYKLLEKTAKNYS